MPGSHIRSFAKLFTNLTPGQQREFERVFADLENSKEISSLETSLSQLKRKPDARLGIPQLEVFPVIRGALIDWEPIFDQRVWIYEIDVSTTNNFSSFTTVTTFGSSVVIDGLDASRFVRVRGVRRDGTTTPYSNVATISPKLFDIIVHSEEDFYVTVGSDDEPTDPTTVVGGDGTDLDYVPINPAGSSKVWGFVSVYGDPAVAMFGEDNINLELKIKTIGKDGSTVLSEATPWKNSIGDFFGCYSVGPVAVEHPELGQGLEMRLEMTDLTVAFYPSQGAVTRPTNNTEVLWAHLNSMELGIIG